MTKGATEMTRNDTISLEKTYNIQYSRLYMLYQKRITVPIPNYFLTQNYYFAISTLK